MTLNTNQDNCSNIYKKGPSNIGLLNKKIYTIILLSAFKLEFSNRLFQALPISFSHVLSVIAT